MTVVARALLVVLLGGCPLGALAGDEHTARLHYAQHCMGCHGVDGRGAPDKGVPSMRGLLPRLVQLPEGRAYLVQVPGVANAAMKDRDIAVLLNWLVPQMLEPGQALPASPPYTAEEVGRWRSAHLLDVPAARQHLVDRLDTSH